MAIISIDPRDPRAIYVQIVDEIRRAIVLGTLGADDALPSVRQLSADLGINPNTVKQAYRELDREGIAASRRGEGTFVSHRPAPDAHRVVLARKVAARALRDAYRHGLTPHQLVDAIEAASRSRRGTSRGTKGGRK